MNEQMVLELLIPVLKGLVGVLLILMAWFTKRAIVYLNVKAKAVELEVDIEDEKRIRFKVDAAIQESIIATQQTFVRALKEKAEDGDLTKDEAKEACDIAIMRTKRILREEGIDIARDVLLIMVESRLPFLKRAGLIKRIFPKNDSD